MKKLVSLFCLVFIFFTGFLVVFQQDVSIILTVILFVLSIIAGLSLGSMLVNLYFESLFNKVKVYYFTFIGFICSTFIMLVSFIFDLPTKYYVYTYILLAVSFIVGILLIVKMASIFKHQNKKYEVKWSSIFFRDEKIEALENEDMAQASRSLYSMAVFLFLIGNALETIMIILPMALISIVFGIKNFKKAACYFTTKGYIFVETLYVGSFVIAVGGYYFTQQKAYLLAPMLAYLVYKVLYYKFLKKKMLKEKP